VSYFEISLGQKMTPRRPCPFPMKNW